MAETIIVTSKPVYATPPLLGGVLKITSYVFSYELLFVLLFYAGRLSSLPVLEVLPVSLTHIVFATSFAAGLYYFAKTRFRFRRRAFELVLWGVVFVMYMIGSLMWTPGRVYASEKAFLMIAAVLWPLVFGSLIIASDRRRIRRFLVIFALLSIWLALVTDMAYMRQQTAGWLDVLGKTHGYLGLGRLIGPGLLILLGYLAYGAKNTFQKAVAFAAAGVTGLALLVIGGRAPFLATALAAVIPALLGFRLARSKIALQRSAILWWILPIVALILLGASVNAGDAPLAVRRLMLALDANSTVWARLDFYQTALGIWAERPLFGHGIGSFPVVTGGMDIKNYPHNLILEVLAESGLVGLLLLGGLVFRALAGLGPAESIRQDPLRLIVLMLFVNVFLNSMTTGDVPDNRFVFGILAMMSFPRLSHPNASRHTATVKDTDSDQPLEARAETGHE
jgi:O-antigen ligase